MSNPVKPTAANIISSLGVRGTRIKGGTAAFAGCIPILGPNGKLDKSVIPIDQIIPGDPTIPLSSVAFVDPASTAEEPTGSIASPFSTISAAASAGFSAIMLAAGTYNEQSLVFGGTPQDAYLIALGKCVINRPSEAMGISGIASGGRIVIHNVTINGTVTVVGQVTAVCTGETYIEQIRGSVQDSGDPLSVVLLTLKLGAYASVGGTNAPVSCLDAHVGNLEVNGHVDKKDSVTGAMYRLTMENGRICVDDGIGD